MKFTVSPLCLAGLVLGLQAIPIHAAPLDAREYVEAVGGGSYTQTGAEAWTFRRGGFDGTLLSPDTVTATGDTAGGWNSPGFQFNVPNTGYLTNTGNALGLDAAPTFDGLWVHPGSGIATTWVYTLQAGDKIDSLILDAEVRFNGGQGSNGIAVSVGVVQDAGLVGVGNNTFTTATSIAGWSVDLSSFNLAAGDRVVLDFTDNGNYLFDHGNVRTAFVVPTPSSAALTALGLFALSNRRRRANNNI